MLDPSETIVAIASHPGPATRGLVRLSGDRAVSLALASFQSPHPSPTPAHPICYSGQITLQDPLVHLPVDLLLWPGPKSYTGQAVAEIHTIGSPPLLNHLVAQYLASGARMAEPGEFTLRAFLSGRIDLAQSEAVLQVIEARTSTDLEAALQKLAGGLTTPLRKLRDRLLDRLVELEAYLDFVEEADVPVVLREALAADMSEAARTLDALIATFKARDTSETRPRVVLVGHPNAGKSKLFNALLGTEQAIVSPIAGTTRDYLIGHCDCDGIPIALIDTAGLEDASNAIMDSAQSHRSHQIAEADLVVHCTPIDESLIEHTFNQPSLNIFTKADLLSEPSVNEANIVTSADNGHGLDALKHKIALTLRTIRSRSETVSTVGSQWHDSLLRAASALRHALEVSGYPGSEELIAAELRQVLEDLGKIVGAVVTEDILDQIFRRFCIGK